MFFKWAKMDRKQKQTWLPPLTAPVICLNWVQLEFCNSYAAKSFFAADRRQGRSNKQQGGAVMKWVDSPGNINVINAWKAWNCSFICFLLFYLNCNLTFWENGKNSRVKKNKLCNFLKCVAVNLKERGLFLSLRLLTVSRVHWLADGHYHNPLLPAGDISTSAGVKLYVVFSLEFKVHAVWSVKGTNRCRTSARGELLQFHYCTEKLPCRTVCHDTESDKEYIMSIVCSSIQEE